MKFFEFTAYIDIDGCTWEGCGYWPLEQHFTLNIDAMIEMQLALKMGLAGHGFDDLSTLQTTMEVVTVNGAMRRRIEESVIYRHEMAGGVMLRWSKLEPYTPEKEGFGHGEG